MAGEDDVSRYGIRKSRVLCCALFSCTSSLACGATDSLVDYSNVETIEVVGQAVVSDSASTGTVNSVDLGTAPLTRPIVLPDAIGLTPSVNIRTNSRGETLASVRGSGDRQLAVFFDGASVNVPWDNRIDLRLLPLSGVARVNVSSGPSSIQYGAGTAGGVVEILPTTDLRTNITGELGSGGQQRIDGKTGFGSGNSQMLFAGGYWRQNGLVAERGSRSDFAAPGSDLITNSDRKQHNFMARLSHETPSGDGVAVSLLYNDAAYGVSPEQGPNFDPNDSRYWRYPKSTYILTTVNGRLALSDNTTSELAVWRQSFDQNIHSFADDTYSVVEDIQEDDNDTYGARTVIAYETDIQRFTVNGSALWSRHTQSEYEPVAGVGPDEVFTQQTLGVGADYMRKINDEMTATIGAGYDVFDPKRTAGRQSAGRFTGVNAVAEINYSPAGDWQWRGSIGRRVRLPTMRELFGEAIGRFALNPDLRPEQTWQFEIAASYQLDNASLQLVPFASITEDTLDQRRVMVGGNSLRQRYNLNGTRTYGMEMQGEAQLSEKVSIDGSVTWNRHHVQRETVDNSTRRLYLSDRPNWLARLNASYQLGAQTTFGLNVVYRGEAQSQDGNGDFQHVNASTQLHVALRHNLLSAPDGSGVVLYVRADNLTDAFVEPQLGLPDQGRTLRFGLSATL